VQKVLFYDLPVGQCSSVTGMHSPIEFQGHWHRVPGQEVKGQSPVKLKVVWQSCALGRISAWRLFRVFVSLL